MNSVLAIRQTMRLDLRNTLDPGLDLQHAAFKSYALHKVYEFVKSKLVKETLWSSGNLKRCVWS